MGMSQSRWGETLRQDLGVRSTLAALELLFTVRGQATLLLRLSHSAGELLPLGGFLLKQLNHLLTGADIAWQAEIGPGVHLYHPTGVIIGPWVRIGNDCEIEGGVTIGGRGFGVERGERDPSPRVGSRVRIGAGAVLFGGIEVGDDVAIGANAVVSSSIENGMTVVAEKPTVLRRNRRSV